MDERTVMEKREWPVVFLAAALLAFATQAENRVKAELIADAGIFAPGESFRAGVLFTIPDGAHIYWRNPGDSGLPTGVEWILPNGVEASALQWPNPKRFTVEGLDDVSYGYAHETLLFSDFTLAPEASVQVVRIDARASWLICLDDGVCIPESAEMSLMLNVDSVPRSPDTARYFETHAARVPKPLDEYRDMMQFVVVKPYLWINFRPPLQAIPEYDGEEVALFPETGPRWDRNLPDGGIGSAKAAFHRAGPDPPEAGGMHALPKGVLTIPIGDPRNNEVRVEYIRIED